MKLIGETPEKMAKRMGEDQAYLEEILPIMDEKGQIIAYKSRSGTKYGLMLFVVGIYEEQLDRMDAEFAAIMEEYFEVCGYTDLFGTEPEIFKVVPVNQAISSEMQVFPYQQASEIIGNAKSWGVRECICKKQQELLDKGCNYSKNVCLTFSSREGTYDETTTSKAITKQEALDLLLAAEEEGLVHSTMNVQEGHNYICNCCTCCCGVLRSMKEYKQPHAFVNSDYTMQVDEEECIGCAECEDRCQFDAISIDGVSVVDAELCVGCGVCAIACEEGALTLVPRKGVKKPPKNMVRWMLKKAWKRKKNPLKAFR